METKKPKELIIKSYTFKKIRDLVHYYTKSRWYYHNDDYSFYNEKRNILRCYRCQTSNTMNTSIKFDLDSRLDKVTYISHNTEGEIILRVYDNNKPSATTTKSTLRLGRLIKILDIENNLKDEEIERVVSEWKKMYTIDASLVEVTDDIQKVYNMNHPSNGDLGGSCMRYQGNRMEIYEDVGCQIAYINTDDELKARALLWNNLEELDGTPIDGVFHDRIFAKDENSRLTLQKYFKDNNIRFVNTLDAFSRPLNKKWYDELPYIDNMYNLDDNYRLNNCGYDNYGQLQSTSGDYDYNGGDEIAPRGKVCCCCGDTYHEDELTYVEYEQDYVCDNCLGNCYVYLEDSGEYFHEDSGDYWTCYNSGSHYYYNDNRIWLDDKEQYVHDRYSDGCIFTEDGFIVWDSNKCIYTEDGYYVYDEDNCFYCEHDYTYYYHEENYLARLEEIKNEND